MPEGDILTRRLLTAASTAAVLAALATPAPAGAAAVKEACVMQAETTFNPGLGITTKSISNGLIGWLVLCHGAGGVTRGLLWAEGYGTGSCVSHESVGTGEVRWNTGPVSTFSVTTTRNGILARMVGRFTSGPFRGLKFTAALAFELDSPLKCLTSGLHVAGYRGPWAIAA
jgi:hypothetical protein